MQLSTVQGLPSLQSAAVTHCWHPAIGVWTQPEEVLQLSAVQAFPSSQLSGDPGLHTPPWQVSVPLQGFRSAQSVPFGRAPSAGQLIPVPLQVSAASHAFAAARHTVPPVAKPSGGQAAAVPVHISATSHGPADGRHCVAGEANASAGQRELVPVHDSTTSHGPADPRHTVPAGWSASSGQVAAVPVHSSAESHGPVAARQTVALEAN